MGTVPVKVVPGQSWLLLHITLCSVAAQVCRWLSSLLDWGTSSVEKYRFFPLAKKNQKRQIHCITIDVAVLAWDRSEHW